MVRPKSWVAEQSLCGDFVQREEKGTWQQGRTWEFKGWRRRKTAWDLPCPVACNPHLPRWAAAPGLCFLSSKPSTAEGRHGPPPSSPLVQPDVTVIVDWLNPVWGKEKSRKKVHSKIKRYGWGATRSPQLKIPLHPSCIQTLLWWLIDRTLGEENRKRRVEKKVHSKIMRYGWGATRVVDWQNPRWGREREKEKSRKKSPLQNQGVWFGSSTLTPVEGREWLNRLVS